MFKHLFTIKLGKYFYKKFGNLFFLLLRTAEKAMSTFGGVRLLT